MSKRLSDIIYGISLNELVGQTGIKIKHIETDSRKIKKRSLFIAVKGLSVDGHRFIDKAIDSGATAVLCEQFPEQLKDDVTYLKVSNTAVCIGIIAANFYNHPSTKLKLVGVTGTNGKTTTATLLFRLFRNLKYNVGLISTIQYQINEQVFEASHTTPDSLQFNRLLQQMLEEGCEYVFCEVSSHSVVQHRIKGLHFAGAIFSNISHDHLDYHGSFKAYIEAKKGFFDILPKTAFALSNVDDKRGRVMLQNTKAKPHTYALKTTADFKVRILENSFEGLILNIDGEEVYSLLIGEFNAYNLLAVYATACLLGEDKQGVLTEISKLKTAEGRFDYVKDTKNKGVTGIVDYAHTPDALLKVLKTIDKIRTRNEQLITIVGCGGDRDKQKRPIMANVACQWSNKVILTSDNPRSEEPEAIIDDMKKGLEPQYANKVLSITSRREAIKAAAMLANKNDIILLAGKGHEKYQIIKGKKYPFDDKEELQKAIENS